MKQLIFLFLITSSIFSIAQPVLNGVDITVKEKYQAQVAEAIKITGQPNVRDTNIEKLPVEINLRSRTLIPSPKMELIPPIRIARTKLYRLPSNTVMLSVGNFYTTRVGFSFGNSRDPIQTWGIQGRHFSSFGGFKVTDEIGLRKSVFENSSWLENGLSGHYNRVLRRGRLLTRASANFDRYSFYGQPHILGTNDIDTTGNAPLRWIQDYQAEAKYDHSGYRRKQIFQSAHIRAHHWIDQGGRQVETGINSAIDWRLPVEDLFLELPLKASFNKLSGTSRMDSMGRLLTNNYWSAQFAPAIADSVGNVSFKLGLNLIFDGVISDSSRKLSLPYLPPVIHVEFPLVKNVLNIYGGYEGSVQNGGMRLRVNQTSFLSENSQYEIVRSSSLYGGVNGRLSSAIGYRFGARQRSYENYAMVTRDPNYSNNGIDSGRLLLEYVELIYFEPSGELTFQNSLGWEFRGFALLRMGINDSNKPIYHLPSSQIGGQIHFNLKDKIRFESTIIRHGERKAPLMVDGINLLPYWDGRLSVVYTYNDKLNATLKIDNIFNSQIDWWSGYSIQGFRANLGLVYKF
jgi:hypothetical protein|tara:strand:- start:11519 stop:13234 length:1716 start_codon:yes stop_codon:yes gene_type:complete